MRRRKPQTFEEMIAESKIDMDLLEVRMGWMKPTDKRRVEHWLKYSVRKGKDGT